MLAYTVFPTIAEHISAVVQNVKRFCLSIFALIAQ